MWVFKAAGLRRPRFDLSEGRALARGGDVPVIMITAYGDAETRRKVLEGGAEALLTKPIDFDLLRNEIDGRIARAE